MTRFSDSLDQLDTNELFTALRTVQDPNLRARIREHLISRHEGLVRHVVKDYAASGESYEDLYGVGMLGLINAVDRFDPARGTRFATFAVPTIRGEIRRYFRDKTWGVRVPRRIQELSLKARDTVEHFTQVHGRTPTYSELARELGVTEEEAIEALEVSRQYELPSIERSSENNDEALAEIDRTGALDAEIETIADRDALLRAVQKLPPRERMVIMLRFFAGLSQQQVGERLRVSQMHVSRLQNRALQKLRTLLQAS
ncbi:MAG: SigB/SigF/SigG family RNA polymerase sigma factor [Armatimonadetes bacterium]|nr:SigB/SigF/SigG family RNA polymerase sigma factor [Armatimonadota bacterium]